MRIVGYSIGDHIIVNSDGETCNNGYLDWLIRHEDGVIRVVLDIQKDLSNLFNNTGISSGQLEELRQTTKLKVGSYKFRYIPEKFFSVKRNGAGFGYYCNIGQYFKNQKWISYFILNSNTQEAICYNIANTAKISGEIICKILTNCGIEVKSLTSLERIWENTSQDVKVKCDYEWLKERIWRELEE